MLTEAGLKGAISASSILHVTIDGVHKTIAGGTPTGEALHALAGYPEKLFTVAGDEVKKDFVEVKDYRDGEFFTSFDVVEMEEYGPHITAPELPAPPALK